MRKTTLVTIVSLLALVGILAGPPGSVAAAASAVKVVVIVGPVGSQTARYKADADAAASEALKYTPNVVKVYTPNATWTAAKNALQGASIVIYMGHGNGFPSPYRTTPWPLTQNGLGLNPTAGGNDSTTQYYGEQFLANEVRLAPNAIVLLHHLCYASGNSEPGRGEPTLSVARQRIDNFGAGWLRTGAKAVIADAHYGASYYVTALFTASEPVDALWRGAPSARGNYATFSSSRTPGATGQMDPEAPASGFYRSFVGDPTLMTDAVTGGASGVAGAVFGTPTSGDPASFVVPGTAVVTGAAGGGPQILGIDDAGGAFSPNGDGRDDVFQLAGTLSEEAAWSVTFADSAGAIIAQLSGFSSTFGAAWDGLIGGARAPDGAYRYTVTATDQRGTPPATRSGTVAIDSTAPTVAPATATALAPAGFSPNGDGVADTVSVGLISSDAGVADLTVVSGYGQQMRTVALPIKQGRASVAWDGRSDAGPVVPDGLYVLTITPRDAAGNVGASLSKPVYVYTAVSAVRSSLPAFYPQDPNGTAPATTTLSFMLAAPATVTWTVSDAAGRTVFTQYQDVPLPPGAYAFDWNGRDPAGNVVPPGTFYSNVRATDGTLALRTRAPFAVGAFAIKSSVTAPARGQTITVTATSAEQLGPAPRLTVAQPGTAVRTVTMSRVGSSYRATIALRRTTQAGALVLTVTGQDLAGVPGSSVITLPVH